MKKKSFLEKILGGGKSRISKKNTEEEDSSITEERQDMIKGVMDLSDTTVKEIIVPRIDVVFLSEVQDIKDLLEKITSSGHSRFPVYGETIDNVIGILYVKDLLRHMIGEGFPSSGSISLKGLMRQPFFIPDSKRLDSLLREMKRRRVHIAVAVDEYGGVSGIICMEDILEVIVGNLQDEFDNDLEDFLKIGEDTWLCDARVTIDDFNEELGMELHNEDFDTLGGFVFDLFGKIPVRYEKVSGNGLDFIIQNMEGYKIKTIKVVRKP